MSIEVFEDSTLPSGDAQSAALRWLDEARGGYLDACDNYALQPSEEAQDAVRTQLNESTAALKSVVTALTETDMSETAIPIVATLLYREDLEFVTKLRKLAPDLTFVELQEGKVAALERLSGAHEQAYGNNDVFAEAVSKYLNDISTHDLESFLAWVNQQHAWGRMGKVPEPEIEEVPEPQPESETEPSYIQSPRQDILDIAKMAAGRLGRLTMYTLTRLTKHS